MYPRVKEKAEVGKVNVAVEAHNVEIDGLTIRYLAAGEGPPMVLLHGAGDNSLDWRWMLRALARKHRVYAPACPALPTALGPPPITRLPSSSGSQPAFSMLWA